MFTDVVTAVTLFDVIGIGLSIGQIDGCGIVVVAVVVVIVVTADGICDKFDNCGGGGRIVDVTTGGGAC